MGTEKKAGKLDQKVNTVNEIASAKPKPIKAKRKLDKMRFVNEQLIKLQIKTPKNLMLGNFNFDPKLILNIRLIFNTTIKIRK